METPKHTPLSEIKATELIMINMGAVEFLDWFIHSSKNSFTVLSHIASVMGPKLCVLPKETKQIILDHCFNLPGCAPNKRHIAENDFYHQAHQACLR